MDFPNSQFPSYDQQNPETESPSTSRRRGQNRMPARWDYQHVKVLLVLMAQLIDEGYRRGNKMSTQVYDRLLEAFNNRTGCSLSLTQIKSKVDLLKREWRAWMELKNPKSRVTGMGWNYERNTWEAPDEWWAHMQQVNPLIIKFRERGMEHIELMEKVFHGTTATGEFHWTPTAAPDTPDIGQASGAPNQPEFVASGGTPPPQDSNMHDAEGVGISSGSGKRTRPEGDDMEERYSVGRRRHAQTRSFGQAIDRMVDVVQKKSDEVRISFSARGCGLNDCVAKLLTIDGVVLRSELYYWAMDYFKVPVNRECFMSQPDDQEKLNWLLYEKNKQDRLNSSPTAQYGTPPPQPSRVPPHPNNPPTSPEDFFRSFFPPQ